MAIVSAVPAHSGRRDLLEQFTVSVKNKYRRLLLPYITKAPNIPSVVVPIQIRRKKARIINNRHGIDQRNRRRTAIHVVHGYCMRARGNICKNISSVKRSVIELVQIIPRRIGRYGNNGIGTEKTRCRPRNALQSQRMNGNGHSLWECALASVGRVGVSRAVCRGIDYRGVLGSVYSVGRNVIESWRRCPGAKNDIVKTGIDWLIYENCHRDFSGTKRRIGRKSIGCCNCIVDYSRIPRPCNSVVGNNRQSRHWGCSRTKRLYLLQGKNRNVPGYHHDIERCRIGTFARRWRKGIRRKAYDGVVYRRRRQPGSRNPVYRSWQRQSLRRRGSFAEWHDRAVKRDGFRGNVNVDAIDL